MQDAPVGAVTGDHAQAMVAQGADPALRRRIEDLLHGIEGRIAWCQELMPEERQRALHAVREVKAEIARAEPNRARLAALLLAVARAIRAAASLKPASDALKALIEVPGARLPG